MVLEIMSDLALAEEDKNQRVWDRGNFCMGSQTGPEFPKQWMGQRAWCAMLDIKQEMMLGHFVSCNVKLTKPSKVNNSAEVILVTLAMDKKGTGISWMREWQGRSNWHAW